MGGYKIKQNLKLIAFFGLLLFQVASLSAFDWVSLTSYDEVRAMRVIDNRLYLATSGGLLIVNDAAAAGEQYTNTDGLGTVDITDLVADDAGRVWICGDGKLINFNGLASERLPVLDNDNEPIRLLCLADDNDYLWLGSEIGLILFSKTTEGGQIEDAFQQFGDLNPAPEIYDLILTSDSIWLATSAGLAVADRTNMATLKSPASWTGFSMSSHSELTTNTVTALARWSGDTYVGTVDAFYRLDLEADSLIEMAPAYAGVLDLVPTGDSLYLYRQGGVQVMVEGAVSGVSTSGVDGLPTTGIAFEGERWLAAKGVYHGNGSYQEYPYTGLPDNEITDVAFQPNGEPVLLTKHDGPFLRINGEWIQKPIVVRDWTMAMKADASGTLYVGTFGGGMSRVADTVARYYNLNSTFQEATAVGTQYVVCHDVALGGGYFFGVNFEPRDDTKIAIADLNNMDDLSGWTLLSAADGIGGVQLVSADYYAGALAIASQTEGAYYYYLGGDPFNKADDSLAHFYRLNPNFRQRVRSDVVRVVRFSPDGHLWAGTNFGVSRFDPSIEAMVDFDLPAGIGPDITMIEFDSRGNVWIGARNGIASVDASTGDIELFHTVNSDLINDQINNITFDPRTGDIWIATPGGVSVVKSTIGPPTEEVTDAYAFPNPYIVRSPDDLLNFNFARGATLRVFTVAGELVVDKDELVWDGRNQSGEPVASGVYLYVLTDENGEVGRGKILLVRER